MRQTPPKQNKSVDENKLEKTIEFILESQAQFYADLQQVQETNKQIQETQREGEKRTNVLERVCLNLYNSSVEQLNTTVEQGKNIAELTEDTKKLREAQKETDERLSAVILMAERFLGGRNGKSE